MTDGSAGWYVLRDYPFNPYICMINHDISIMNAFDRHRKGFTAWCEDCSEVFDVAWVANMHRDQKRHKIRVTEFWITGRR